MNEFPAPILPPDSKKPDDIPPSPKPAPPPTTEPPKEDEKLVKLTERLTLLEQQVKSTDKIEELKKLQTEVIYLGKEITEIKPKLEKIGNATLAFSRAQADQSSVLAAIQDQLKGLAQQPPRTHHAPPQPAKTKGSNSRFAWMTIALMALLAFLAFAIWMYANRHVGIPLSAIAPTAVVATTNASMPDESTRKIIIDSIKSEQEAVQKAEALCNELSRANFALSRAESNATQRIVIGGNVGNGNIIAVGSKVTVQQVQPPVNRMPPKPVTYVPPQETPPPIAYMQSPPSQVVYEGTPYGYYSSRPGINFEFGIGIGRRHWTGPPPIGNNYGYGRDCSPRGPGGQYNSGRHR